MIFTHFGCRFRVNVCGGLDLWLDDRWIRFGWDVFGLEPGEWVQCIGAS